MHRDLFQGLSRFEHSQKMKIGVLIANLGTPDAPTPAALRSYLKQFLGDPRAIEYQRLAWWLILNLFILPTRPKRSAALYKKVWTEAGSPLLLHTLAQADEIGRALPAELRERIVIEVGMSYGNPSMAKALTSLREQGVNRLLVLPMFPQYSGTTTGATFDAVVNELKKWRWVPELRTVGWYHDDPFYIDALAQSVTEQWQQGGEPEKLLFSFHGIPKRYFMNGDPYHCHCHKTARLVAERLGLSKDRYIVAFQSLFGKEEWLRPYAHEVIAEIAQSGVKRLDVIAPGFTADCLETLEEIGVEYRELFESKAGHAPGLQYRYIPALNSRPAFINALVQLIRTHCGNWLTAAEAAPAEVLERARRVGATR